MTQDYGWGYDLALANNNLGLESFTIGMGPEGGDLPPSTSKPINIVQDDGVFYATLYVCHALDDSIPSQQLCIWLSTLKDTDRVVLNIFSMRNDLPLGCLINLFTALVSTKARLEINLDYLVCDSIAYFYLVPEKIIKGSEGALFIPSYSLHRSEDASGPVRAVHDFFKWLTDEAVNKGLLLSEEADRLQRGSHVVIPNSRLV